MCLVLKNPQNGDHSTPTWYYSKCASAISRSLRAGVRTRPHDPHHGPAHLSQVRSFASFSFFLLRFFVLSFFFFPFLCFFTGSVSLFYVLLIFISYFHFPFDFRFYIFPVSFFLLCFFFKNKHILNLNHFSKMKKKYVPFSKMNNF